MKLPKVVKVEYAFMAIFQKVTFPVNRKTPKNVLKKSSVTRWNVDCTCKKHSCFLLASSPILSAGGFNTTPLLLLPPYLSSPHRVSEPRRMSKLLFCYMVHSFSFFLLFFPPPVSPKSFTFLVLDSAPSPLSCGVHMQGSGAKLRKNFVHIQTSILHQWFKI